MKPKRKVVIGSIVLLIFSYLLWTQRPVNIIWAGSKIKYDSAFAPEFNVCNDRNFGAYDIVVNHLALTEWGRIHWYLDHKDELKKKYGIPSCDSWIITFWDIGGGFTDIKTSGIGISFVSPRQKNQKNIVLKKIYSWM